MNEWISQYRQKNRYVGFFEMPFLEYITIFNYVTLILWTSVEDFVSQNIKIFVELVWAAELSFISSVKMDHNNPIVIGLLAQSE